jgi:HAD superfamily hydrolase (TIGR01509 family)
MKAILFDLDDTLVESMHVLELALVHLFEKLEITMDANKAREIFISMTMSEVIHYIKCNFDIEQDEAWMFNELRKDVAYQYANTIQAKPGVVEYIKSCANKNIKMAVLTSNYKEIVQVVLKRFKILDCIDEIYSAEELHMSKREPDIYVYALKEMNVECKDACLFEDSIYAIQVAQKLGIECIGLVNTSNKSDFETNHIKMISDYTELL